MSLETVADAIENGTIKHSLVISAVCRVLDLRHHKSREVVRHS
jgi:hypothetical protein